MLIKKMVMPEWETSSRLKSMTFLTWAFAGKCKFTPDVRFYEGILITFRSQ